MEENNISLQKEQACESAPKIGSILFALFYTFCLYRNTSGITYPFFVAGSLLYLFYCIKKYGSTAGKENYCIAGSMMLLGVIQCTTDSAVIVWTNRYMIWGLGLIILIRSSWRERILEWAFFGWMRTIMQVAFGGIIKGFYLFSDVWESIKARRETGGDGKLAERRRVAKAVLLGVLVAIPIVLVIFALLSSADALFRDLFARVFRFMEDWHLPDFLTNGKVWGCLFMIGSSCLAVYGLGKLFLCTDAEEAEECCVQEEKERPDPITGLIIVGAVGVVYLLFCFIQIFGLFLGKMSLPEGYTYAKYAREGFFQLAALCAMNIFFVMVIAKRFELSRLMKCFLIVVSGCTYIMIASSAYKMIMYVKVYQMSFLRLTVLWALVVMTVLMSGVVYRILTERDHLVRFFFIVLIAAYCIFVAARPDYLIARYNVSQKDFSGEGKLWQTVDFRYLYHDLSTDAAPVWIRALGKPDDATEVKYILMHLKEEKDHLSFRTFNFSRYFAGVLAEKALEEKYGTSWKEESDDKINVEKGKVDGVTSEYEWNSDKGVDLPGPATSEPEQGLSEAELREVPTSWLSIKPDATWEFEDGNKWEFVPVDAACGSRFYALLEEDAQGKKSLINADPFHGEGGGSIWLKFVGEIGFASMTYNGGDESTLYRTDDMGQHFSLVEIPPVMEQLSNGEYFTPYDTPVDVWADEDTIFLLVGQGEDGDFYKDGKKAAAVYVSTDQGETWYYLDAAK